MKKTTLVTIVLTIVIVIGVSAYFIYSNQSQPVSNQSQDCQGQGKGSRTIGSQGPDAVFNFGECCPGLVELFDFYETEPFCEFGEGGVVYFCSDCGNGKCDERENKCNCPVDCKKKDECQVADDCGQETNITKFQCKEGVCWRI